MLFDSRGFPRALATTSRKRTWEGCSGDSEMATPDLVHVCFRGLVSLSSCGLGTLKLDTFGLLSHRST